MQVASWKPELAARYDCMLVVPLWSDLGCSSPTFVVIKVAALLQTPAFLRPLRLPGQALRWRLAAALLPRLFWNNVPGHTTWAPQVGFKLATNCIQFYAIQVKVANLNKTWP